MTHDPSSNDLHDADEFFQRGDDGSYAGGPRESVARPLLLEEPEAPDEKPDPRLVQLRIERRARFTRLVGTIVAVLGLASTLAFAHRALTTPSPLELASEPSPAPGRLNVEAMGKRNAEALDSPAVSLPQIDRLQAATAPALLEVPQVEPTALANTASVALRVQRDEAPLVAPPPPRNMLSGESATSSKRSARRSFRAERGTISAGADADPQSTSLTSLPSVRVSEASRSRRTDYQPPTASFAD